METVKKEKDKRNKKIAIGLTFWENLIVAWRSEKLGLTKSAYVRQKALEKGNGLSDLKEMILAIDKKLSSMSFIQSLHPPSSLDKLKKPKPFEVKSKEQISMGDCINEMKRIFQEGITILQKVPEEEIQAIQDARTERVKKKMKKEGK